LEEKYQILWDYTKLVEKHKFNLTDENEKQKQSLQHLLNITNENKVKDKEIETLLCEVDELEAALQVAKCKYTGLYRRFKTDVTLDITNDK